MANIIEVLSKVMSDRHFAKREELIAKNDGK